MGAVRPKIINSHGRIGIGDSAPSSPLLLRARDSEGGAPDGRQGSRPAVGWAGPWTAGMLPAHQM